MSFRPASAASPITSIASPTNCKTPILCNPLLSSRSSQSAAPIANSGFCRRARDACGNRDLLRRIRLVSGRSAGPGRRAGFIFSLCRWTPVYDRSARAVPHRDADGEPRIAAGGAETQIAARELVTDISLFAALPALQVRAVGDRLDLDFRVDHEPRLDRRARRQMRKMLGIDFVETGEIRASSRKTLTLTTSASEQPASFRMRVICTIAASVCSSIEPRGRRLLYRAGFGPRRKRNPALTAGENGIPPCGAPIFCRVTRTPMRSLTLASEMAREQDQTAELMLLCCE